MRTSVSFRPGEAGVWVQEVLWNLSLQILAKITPSVLGPEGGLLLAHFP